MQAIRQIIGAKRGGGGESEEAGANPSNQRKRGPRGDGCWKYHQSEPIKVSTLKGGQLQQALQGVLGKSQWGGVTSGIGEELLPVRGTQGCDILSIPGKELEQLPTPEMYRMLPMKGHLGRDKTKKWLIEVFLAWHSHRCSQILQFLPRLSTSSHWEMSSVPTDSNVSHKNTLWAGCSGPHRKEHYRYQYILVLENAARYLEAVPVWAVTASKISGELLRIFARLTCQRKYCPIRAGFYVKGEVGDLRYPQAKINMYLTVPSTNWWFIGTV